MAKRKVKKKAGTPPKATAKAKRKLPSQPKPKPDATAKPMPIPKMAQANDGGGALPGQPGPLPPVMTTSEHLEAMMSPASMKEPAAVRLARGLGDVANGLSMTMPFFRTLAEERRKWQDHRSEMMRALVTHFREAANELRDEKPPDIHEPMRGLLLNALSYLEAAAQASRAAMDAGGAGTWNAALGGTQAKSLEIGKRLKGVERLAFLLRMTVGEWRDNGTTAVPQLEEQRTWFRDAAEELWEVLRTSGTGEDEPARGTALAGVARPEGYQPARWFEPGASQWLRQASRSSRRSKKVRKITEADGTRIYLVADVKLHKPELISPSKRT